MTLAALQWSCDSQSLAVVLWLSKPCSGFVTLKALQWSYDSKSLAIVLWLSEPCSGLVTLKSSQWSYKCQSLAIILWLFSDSETLAVALWLSTLKVLRWSYDSQSLVMMVLWLWKPWDGLMTPSKLCEGLITVKVLWWSYDSQNLAMVLALWGSITIKAFLMVGLMTLTAWRWSITIKALWCVLPLSITPSKLSEDVTRSVSERLEKWNESFTFCTKWGLGSGGLSGMK